MSFASSQNTDCSFKNVSTSSIDNSGYLASADIGVSGSASLNQVTASSITCPFITTESTQTLYLNQNKTSGDVFINNNSANSNVIIENGTLQTPNLTSLNNIQTENLNVIDTVECAGLAATGNIDCASLNNYAAFTIVAYGQNFTTSNGIPEQVNCTITTDNEALYTIKNTVACRGILNVSSQSFATVVSSRTGPVDGVYTWTVELLTNGSAYSPGALSFTII